MDLDLKLSEAIRLGSMYGPQVFNRYYDIQSNGSCALGAASMAVGKMIYLAQQLYRKFPILRVIGHCPVPGCSISDNRTVSNDSPVLMGYELGGLIPHLNDGHLWTREQIANWVERIELAHEKRNQDTREQDRGAGVSALCDTGSIVVVKESEESELTYA